MTFQDMHIRGKIAAEEIIKTFINVSMVAILDVMSVFIIPNDILVGAWAITQENAFLISFGIESRFSSFQLSAFLMFYYNETKNAVKLCLSIVLV